MYPAAVVDRTLAPCDMGLTAFVTAALSAAASAGSLSSDITVGERPFCFE